MRTLCVLCVIIFWVGCTASSPSQDGIRGEAQVDGGREAVSQEAQEAPGGDPAGEQSPSEGSGETTSQETGSKDAGTVEASSTETGTVEAVQPDQVTEPSPSEAPPDAGGADAAPDAGSGATLRCNGGSAFPAQVDQSCSTDSDCVVVTHMIDCCGTMIAIGIRASTKTSFESAEKQCAATFPACGCPSRPTKTDDGSQAVGGAAKAAAACVSGRCVTYIEGCKAPCPQGSECYACSTGGANTFSCSTSCATSADCTDKSKPNCNNTSYGTKFCSDQTQCNAP